jgi:hypothetical protein
MVQSIHYPGMARAKGEGNAGTKSDAVRLQITITVNKHFLERLVAIGAAVGRNRSEMIDRAIEEYVERRQPLPRQDDPRQKPVPR